MNFNPNRLLWTAVTLAAAFSGFAQDDTDPDSPNSPTYTSPINQWVIYLGVAALVFAFYQIKAYRSQKAC